MSPQLLPIVVLHLLGPLRPSGMERMLVSAASHFRSENVTSVILGQGPDHPYADELRAAGYDVRIMPAVGDSLRSALALRSLAKDLNVDVIHIHTEGNYLRTALASRLAVGWRGRVVRTIHNVFDAKGFWKLSRIVQSILADRLLSALVAPSPDVAENEKSIGRNAQVIFNWVDDRLYSIKETRKSRERGAPLALIVGNCSQIKHHELALLALQNTHYNLIHLGDEVGASDEERTLLEELAVAGRMVGRGAMPPDFALKQADYFLMPSRHEGMPVALAEALVAGVPAFVTNVPGLKWASGFPGVTVLSESQRDWEAALSVPVHVSVQNEVLPIDFGAARGAKEYAQIYRSNEPRKRE
jgi:glycosyltransferase involved in cell wall biosynthesis